MCASPHRAHADLRDGELHKSVPAISKKRISGLLFKYIVLFSQQFITYDSLTDD